MGRWVVGNWKLNGTRAEAAAWAHDVAAAALSLDKAGVRMAVAPPATAWATMAQALGDVGVRLAAQDLFYEDRGAFTGALSAPLCKDAGVSMALVGHSERRAWFGDTDADCAQRILACARHTLTPILCVGESLAEREAGQTEAVVLRQLAQAMPHDLDTAAAPFLLAYEPVWAIGTGKVATPAQAQAVHQALRRALALRMGPVQAAAVPILYGGSVKPDNAAALFAQPDIDGALVGGASLDAQSFLAIARAGLSFSS